MNAAPTVRMIVSNRATILLIILFILEISFPAERLGDMSAVRRTVHLFVELSRFAAVVVDLV